MIKNRGCLVAAALFTLVTAGIGFPHPALAAVTIHDCPTSEGTLSADITNPGNGGMVAFTCGSATVIGFDGAHGGTGPITISQTVTLDASGATGGVTIDGGRSTQLLKVNSGVTFFLSHMTLARANAVFGTGGAVDNSGTLAVANSILYR
jgi:hypothetical protein